MEIVLSIDEQGKAELLINGVTRWASDSDPEIVDAFGTDFFVDEAADDSEVEAEDVIRYLRASGVLTREEFEAIEIEGPGDDDEDDDDDDGEDDL